jgi:ATP-binding cassette, subfamily B, bacterial
VRRAYRGPSLYGRLMREARPYWLQIAGLFALGMLSSVFALLTPLPLKIAVDSVVGSHPLPAGLALVLPPAVQQSQTLVLLVAGALFVLISLSRQLQEFGKLLLTIWTGEQLVLHLRSRLFRHAERLPLAYHDARGTVDSAYRIQYDAAAIQDVAVAGLLPFFTATMTVAGMIFVTARIDWQLALVSVAVVPVLFLTTSVYRKRLRAQSHDAKRCESSALSVVQQSLGALRVVKAFGREDHARDRFVERSAASVRAKIRLALVEGRFGVVVGATIGLGMGTVLFLGTRHVLAGTITLGELVLVMGYLQQLYDPLKTASKKMGSLQASLASAERVYALLDEAPDFVDPPRARPLVRAAGAVTFRNVSFAYQPGHGVLHDVSFEAGPGTRLGIAGTTGAGKTTLVSLLMRFYEPASGQILLDGIDVRDYRLADLRSQFAMVLQEPVLFAASIAENIAYARPGASEAEIVAAAEAAGAHDFIRALPDGYDTAVGERGVRLSGGERQRIGIARAFLKDAPILILDEPTSSVDGRTEAGILDAMARLMSRRTTFLIAHRPTTLAICDTVLQLEHGRIVVPTPRDTGRVPAAAHRAAGAEPWPAGARCAPRPRRAAVPCDPVDHPVVRAWRAIAPAGRRVHRVDRLRATEKTEIYRLTVEDGAARIIAKRARSRALLVERTIYEGVLPHLPLPGLRLHGYYDEDGASAWLFIEDAGDEPCSPAQNRRLAARWLGALHGAGAELDLPRSLPEVGPARHLEHLRAARTTIRDNFDNPALGADDRSTLEAVLSACDLVESRWGCVEAICAGLPRRLAHGDFVERNLRLRRDHAGSAIVAFDWEGSGFGVPAADVHRFAVDATPEDLASYRTASSQYGRGVDRDELRALLLVGKGFQLVASVDWATQYLRHPWVERPMATLSCYERPLRAWAGELAVEEIGR